MSAAVPASSPSPVNDPDRTARARIRDAAIERFAEDGVAATSLKSIAADVGVSPPLIIHHFGSKEGLRVACDEHVAAVIRTRKRQAMTGGLDPLQALRESDEGPPLMRYLARTLADGSPHVGALIDEMVEDAIAYTAEGIEHGVLKPCEHPREQAIVLAIWGLGALVLHEHVRRHLGADLTGPAAGFARWAVPAAEILARGVIEETFYERWRGALQEYEEQQSQRKAGT